MLAMVLNLPGDEHTFHAEERAIPVSTSTDSVLKIMAFGLNYAELLTRNGESPDVKFPRVIASKQSAQCLTPQLIAVFM